MIRARRGQARSKHAGVLLVGMGKIRLASSCHLDKGAFFFIFFIGLITQILGIPVYGPPLVKHFIVNRKRVHRLVYGIFVCALREWKLEALG